MEESYFWNCDGRNYVQQGKSQPVHGWCFRIVPLKCVVLAQNADEKFEKIDCFEKSGKGVRYLRATGDISPHFRKNEVLPYHPSNDQMYFSKK